MANVYCTAARCAPSLHWLEKREIIVIIILANEEICAILQAMLHNY